MKNKYYTQLMYSPEGESPSGGGTATMEAPKQSSPPQKVTADHDIASIFNKTGSEAIPGQGAESAAAEETKPAEIKTEAKAAPKEAPKEGEKKPASLLDRIKEGPKSTEEKAKPAETPAELPEDKLQLGAQAKGETARVLAELKTITKAVRADVAARDAEIAELKKKLSSAPAGAPINDPAVDQLKAEHKAALDRLAVLDLQSHPSYQKEFAKPRAEITDGLKALLSGTAVDGMDLGALTNLPLPDFRKAVNEAAAKLGDFERGTFVDEARKLYSLEQKSKAARDNAGELGKNLHAKLESEQRAEFREVIKSLGDADGVLNSHEIPEHAEGEGRAMLEEYNKSVESIPIEAEKILFSAKSNKDLSLVASKAAMFDHLQKHGIPVIREQYGALLKIVKEQEAQLKDLKGAKRAASSVGAADSSDGKEKTMHDMHVTEAVKKIRWK